MENSRGVARASWADAQKIRSDILAKLASLKKERGNVNYTTRFEEIEQTMAQLRLSCLQVIFHEFEYAVDKKVETSLWQAHTFLNGEYRKVMSRLMAQNQVVQRRKLDKLYRGFLKTSESFYRVYIQRLSARFFIPELRQAAFGTELAPTETAPDEVSPPKPLRSMVLKSCQTTLVRLGDLARYRCQTSEKLSKGTFDKALDYYGLANILDPQDGSAHHQMAVLHQLQGQHLDIVYHFHRAIAIAKPHELALGNLEREFRGLENTSTSRRGNVKDPSEAMVTWFVRLHAFFFQGEQFSQQAELEEEVLHRIDLAMKVESTDAPETLLQKMVLINIAAYDIATEKVKASWTMTASQTCQFLLRFNVRTILILLRTLKNVLHDATTQSEDIDKGPHGEESPIPFTPALMKLLPLVRIYISWIYVATADIVKYQDFLEPYVRDVYRLLGDALTALNVYVNASLQTVSSKYLLLEDLEAQGLRPLDDQQLPLFFRAEEQSKADLPRKHRTPKPRQIVFGHRFKPETEAIWRIRDIVCCGVFLAGNSAFPLALISQLQGQSAIETWVFTDEVQSAVCSDAMGMSRVLSKLRLGELSTASQSPAQAIESPRESLAKANDRVPVKVAPLVKGKSLDKGKTVEKGKTLEKGKAVEKGKSLEKPQEALLVPDLSEDSAMVSMVNDLVGPMDEAEPAPGQVQDETSYGMNSSTANEVFGRLGATAAQPSPVSKAIPSLPWGYFYTPTPHRSTSQGQNEFPPSSDHVPRSAGPQFDAFGSPSYLNNFSSEAGQPKQTGPFLSRSGSSSQSPGLFPETSSGGSSSKQGPMASVESSRNAVLDNLASALFAQHGLAPNKAQPMENFSTRPVGSPLHAQRPGSGLGFPESPFLRGLGTFGDDGRNGSGPSPMQRPVSWLSHQSPPGPPGQSRAANRSGSAMEAAAQLARATNSPLNNTGAASPLGLSYLNSAQDDPSAGAFQQQYSPWLPTAPTAAPQATSSSFAFSHPSSIYGGTPFGRLGGETNGHDARSPLGASGNGDLDYNRQQQTQEAWRLEPAGRRSGKHRPKS
ncbi:hypothetical protein F4780DRAFT_546985 [Xylariomycetidae sp. FL0641]|nr:hypothetical protein F4780DRAFT_546985 [Xylariomycetidae sp. FL0641]